MSFALRFFIQHLRAGQLNILLLAMLIATSSVYAIGLFTDRLNLAIKKQANQVLAADAQIVGSRPINADWVSELTLPRKDSFITEFNAMVQFDNQMRMTSIKAVDDLYPLIGQIGISEQAFVEGESVSQGPLPGNIWLSSRLIAALDIEIGSQVRLGQAEFFLEKVLMSAPDETFSIYASDAALINKQDLAKTEVLKPGSRARYKWLIGAQPAELAQLKAALSPMLGEHHRWRDVAARNENIDSTLGNAENFFKLVAALALILAAIALVMASTRFSKQHTQSVALLKTLGLSPNKILALFVWQLLFVAFISIIIGLILGYSIHFVLFWILSDILPSNIPPASWHPIFNATATALVSLFAFAGPTFFSLRSIAPVRILRDMAIDSLGLKSKIGFAVLALVFILWLLTDNLLLTLLFLCAACLMALMLWLFSHFSLKLVQKYSHRYPRFMALGVNNLARQGVSNGLQMMMFAFALMLLFTLYLVRTSLVSDWQQSIPENTDNYFLFNIFAEEKAGYESWLQNNQLILKPLYPMLRGRLVQVQDQSIEQLTAGKMRSRDLTREINLTWAQALPTSNKITAGQWWQTDSTIVAEQPILASIEQNWADELGIQVGDQVHFSIGGLDMQATVESLREVNWQSLQPNFYVIFNQPIFDGVGASYLTSFYLPSGQQPALVALLKKYPTFSLVELERTIKQVQEIIAQVSLAVEFILLLVLLAGLLVLMASVQASIDARLHHNAIIRSFGASKRLITGSLWVEFLLLGLLAGLIAVLCSQGLLIALQTWLFKQSISVHLPILIIGPLLAALLIACLGYLFTKKVTQTAPLQVLRNL